MVSDTGKELLGDLFSLLIYLSTIHVCGLMIVLFLLRRWKLFVNISVILHPFREDCLCLSLAEAHRCFHHHHYHHFIATVVCGGGPVWVIVCTSSWQIPCISLVSYISPTWWHWAMNEWCSNRSLPQVPNIESRNVILPGLKYLRRERPLL